MSQSRTANLRLLSGWKEIANYLRKGVRTVQRYEREQRLPVRRPTGGPKGSVIATVAELDAWVRAMPIRSHFSLAAPKWPVATVEELRTNLEKMQQLCAEMRQCRSEMKLSMDALHSTIHGTIRPRTPTIFVEPRRDGLERQLAPGARKPN
jgi:hypothetical protein